jgi:hypothetical protein
MEDGSRGGCPRKCAGARLTLQIYHRRLVNARLTLIGRARRSIGRIGRAGGPGRLPASQTTLHSAPHHRSGSALHACAVNGGAGADDRSIHPVTTTCMSQYYWAPDVILHFVIARIVIELPGHAASIDSHS